MKMRNLLYSALFVVAVSQILVCIPSEPAQAQSFGNWTEPVPLHIFTPNSTNAWPVVAADPYGRVHVAAARNYNGNNAAEPSGSVFYTRWDGDNWSDPVDILISSQANYAEVRRLNSSHTGDLYLLWISDGKGLFLSDSSELDAASARAWETSTVATEGTDGDFLFYDQDHIALVYVLNSRDIYFRTSKDGGVLWSPDIPIWSPPTDQQAIFTVRLAVGQDGVFHVAWTETDANLGWNPSGVWYARSLDGGATWQDYWNVPDEGSYVNIGFDAQSNIHLLWNHNVGSEDGRYHAWSTDNGKTWSKPEWIFQGLSGRTGFPRMILDSSGTLHQITSGRTIGHESDIYHSIWLDDRWSVPVMVDVETEDAEEGPDVALTNGNVLHVAWRRTDSALRLHDIVYSGLITTAPEIPSQPLLANESMTLIGSTPARTSEPTISANLLSTHSTEPNTTPHFTPYDHSAPSNSPISALAAGIVSSVIIIAIVLLWQLRRSRS